MKLPGVIALIFLVGIVALALAGLFLAGGSGRPVPWDYVLGLVRTSLIQAALSTAFSLLLGTGIALALARRRRFPGRSLIVAMLNAATVLPAIVTVFAVVAVFGRSGWLGGAAGAVGIPNGSWLYGLQGILLAHVVLNAPLAARVLLAALSAIGPEHWRLAAQLGMPPGAVFRFLDWPVLRREAPGVAALIFLACFSSFAIVLALGGGPAVSTLEVAIFEAVRFEADFTRAAILAALQIAICLALLAPVIFLVSRRAAETMPIGISAPRPDAAAGATRLIDGLVAILTVFLIAVPMTAIAVAGVAELGSLADAAVLRALGTSLAIGGPAGVLSVALAVGLAMLARDLRSKTVHSRLADLTGIAALLILVVSPIALSAGLFVVLRRWLDPFAIALPLIVIVNAMMALPFTYRQVEPPLALAAERFGRLADSLGVRGWTRLRLLDWPLLRGPLIVAFAMATALSLGDLGVAAFFGTGGLVTLPVLLNERLGAYRIDEAAAAALLLSLLVMTLFLTAQRLGARR